MKTLLQQRDKRLLLAIGTAIAFFVLVFFVVFPWGVTLSSQVAKWLVAGLCVLLLFICVALVGYIQEPEKVHAAYNQWLVSRARRRGEKIPDKRLSGEERDYIRNKYPGLWH